MRAATPRSPSPTTPPAGWSRAVTPGVTSDPELHRLGAHHARHHHRRHQDRDRPHRRRSRPDDGTVRRRRSGHQLRLRCRRERHHRRGDDDHPRSEDRVDHHEEARHADRIVVLQPVRRTDRRSPSPVRQAPWRRIAEQRDHLGRVSSAPPPPGRPTTPPAIAYDAAGPADGGDRRRQGRPPTATTRPATSTAVTGPSGTTKNTYDARNALLRSGSTDYTYDGSGRLATAKGPDGHHDLSLRRAGQPDRRGPARKARRSATPSTASAAGWPAPAAVRPRGPIGVSGPDPAGGDVHRRPARWTRSTSMTAICSRRTSTTAAGSLPAYLTKGGTAYLEVPDVQRRPGPGDRLRAPARSPTRSTAPPSAPSVRRPTRGSR